MVVVEVAEGVEGGREVTIGPQSILIYTKDAAAAYRFLYEDRLIPDGVQVETTGLSCLKQC